MKSKTATKFGSLFWVGVGLVAASPLLGLVTYALVALLIGEEHLEATNGSSTSLGLFTLLIPVLLGAVLMALDKIFKPNVKNVAHVVVALGVLLLAIGVHSVNLSITMVDGASIGGSILTFAGMLCFGTGLFLEFFKQK